MKFVNAVDKAGLYCETAAAAYWIWTDKAGTTLREVNCKPVVRFPLSARNACAMERKFDLLKSGMVDYVNATDTVTRNQLYWKLRAAVGEE